ncbi:DMT family transporter [Antrihabitans sp. YC2-6]|uniref:DMT family transporter n=1 Tax=Antrihabitans sp. YC2-6 TaxID=2799498 RepID=UPI0027DBF858|nr:DMT family transporter [Antrihabitans sp. YC2-6]
MPAHALAIAFALAAALCIAVGAVLRQRAAAKVPDDELGKLGAVGSLTRVPLWWAGTLVGMGGYIFQAAALGKGSLLLVQPLLVTSLLFALPLGAWLTKRSIAPREWAWAGALTAAVAILVVVGDPRPGENHAEALHWAIIGIIGLPLLAMCLLTARARTGAQKAVLLGVAAGALFGVAAVLTKGVVAVASEGVGALLTSLETYALIVVGITATAVQQNAYQAGDLQASLPASTVTEPVIATALGFAVLGEYLDADKEVALLLVAALVVMAVATIALARESGRSEQAVA